MLLLALDTTTGICSVALGDAQKIMAEHSLNLRRTHSQNLLPLIVSLFQNSGLDKNQLTGLVVNTGPGSFTGIRIGLATALGFCQGLNIPAVGVTTLDVLAEGFAFYPGLICPILDARKNQFYTALYQGGADDLQALEPVAALSLPELLALLDRYAADILFLGDAVESYRAQLKAALGRRYKEVSRPLRENSAALVLQRGLKIWQEGGGNPLSALKPFYLRQPEAERRWREQQGKQGGK